MILNIIDDIYGSEYFSTILIAAIVVLVLLFVIVFVIGNIDAKKEEIKKEKQETEKDITFNEIKEEDKIKEDVTFEFPSISKNLEDFKVSLEAELNDDNEPLLPLEKSQKPCKVLSMKDIENTVVIPVITGEDLEKTLALPKLNTEHIKLEEEPKKISGEGNDYLKQNIFSSSK